MSNSVGRTTYLPKRHPDVAQLNEIDQPLRHHGRTSWDGLLQSKAYRRYLTRARTPELS